MGITFLIWLNALKLCPNSTFLNNIIYLTPFVALVFIRIFLQESIHFSAILGLIIITSGVFFQKMSQKNGNGNWTGGKREIPPEVVAGILAIGNFILRFFTKVPMSEK